MNAIKIVVERHAEGYVAYPLGLKGGWWEKETRMTRHWRTVSQQSVFTSKRSAGTS